MACVKDKQVIVKIENLSSLNRVDEIIEVDWKDILIPDTMASIIVTNNQNVEVPSQILYEGKSTPQKLIFMATIPSNSVNLYFIKEGKSTDFPIRTFGRTIPERKDDFAWENDRIAFRVYGPALANENPSNGIDLWLKRTNEMIVDKFYREELENGKSYHIDHGQGLDCYKVGNTLGAGGIAPFVDDEIKVGSHYKTAKILDTGILRTSFELNYYSIIPPDKKVLFEKKIISLDAGSHLNKAIVSFSGDFDLRELAAGIYLHSEPGDVTTNLKKGIITYCENAVSDAGIPSGRNYVALIFKEPVKNIFQDKEHVAAVIDYCKDQPIEYYFGGGWSHWGFDSDSDWRKYVDEFSNRLSNPLKVHVLQ